MEECGIAILRCDPFKNRTQSKILYNLDKFEGTMTTLITEFNVYNFVLREKWIFNTW
jgi:hypothetical protein